MCSQFFRCHQRTITSNYSVSPASFGGAVDYHHSHNEYLIPSDLITIREWRALSTPSPFLRETFKLKITPRCRFSGYFQSTCLTTINTKRRREIFGRCAGVPSAAARHPDRIAHEGEKTSHLLLVSACGKHISCRGYQ